MVPTQHGLVAGVNKAMLVSRFSIVETSAQLDQPPAGSTRFPFRGPSALHGSASQLHKSVAQVSCTANNLSAAATSARLTFS